MARRTRTRSPADGSVAASSFLPRRSSSGSSSAPRSPGTCSAGHPAAGLPAADQDPGARRDLPRRPVRPGAGRQGARGVRAAAAHEGQVGRPAAEAGPVAGRLHPGAGVRLGPVRRGRGRWVRVIRELYVDIPRKNGKSTTLGGIAVYMTAADGEAGAEVIAAATTTDQAGFVFAPVKALVEKAPALKGTCGRTRRRSSTRRRRRTSRRSRRSPTRSTARTSTARSSTSCTSTRRPDMVETLETGTGSRDQPLIATITTADDGKPGTIYARKRKRIEQLAAPGHHRLDGLRRRLGAEKTTTRSPRRRGGRPTRGSGSPRPGRTWPRKRSKAKDSPADLAKFLRLHLGIRTKQDTRYIELGPWDASAGMVDERS
jgi:hypothetical protein